VAVTQKASKLQVHEPQKIYQVDSHLCVAVTGRQALAADVIKEMRGRCLQHKADYDTLIPVEKLCDATAARFHSFTCNPEQSPLGLSMIVAGRDDLLGTQVYTIDVDGGMAAWKGAVIGKHSDVLSDRLAAMSDLIEGMLDVKDVLPRLERLIREATSSRTDFADDRVNNKLDDGNDEDGDKKCLQIFCGTHTASGAFTWSSVSA
jgi:20S proteasome alpha/beta subunit